jgi:enoyl-CoA hydratase/carnithine racemase
MSRTVMPGSIDTQRSSRRRGPSKELNAMTADQPMTAEQAATLKRLAEAAYELEVFQPNLTGAEAHLRIAMLTAKLKLLDEPPHTL